MFYETRGQQLCDLAYQASGIGGKLPFHPFGRDICTNMPSESFAGRLKSIKLGQYPWPCMSHELEIREGTDLLLQPGLDSAGIKGLPFIWHRISKFLHQRNSRSAVIWGSGMQACTFCDGRRTWCVQSWHHAEL